MLTRVVEPQRHVSVVECQGDKGADSISAGRGVAKVGRAIIYASLVSLLLERLLAIGSDLHLWADGVWFLLRVASTRHYFFRVYDWRHELCQSRIFTYLFEQTPLLLATYLPIHSLRALSLIYGATLYFHGLISLYICYRYAGKRWYMLFPLLSLFAGTMNTEAYISADPNFLVSLYWPVLFIMLFARELRTGAFWLLIVLSVPMVLSYETMMFYGAILAGVCLWRWRRFPDNKTLVAALGVWYLLGGIVAIISTIRPFDPGNRNGFIAGLMGIAHSDNLAAKTSALVLFCCAALLSLPRRRLALALLSVVAGLLPIIYLSSEVLASREPAALDSLMEARVMSLVAPIVASGLLFATLGGWLKPRTRTIRSLAILVGSLGVGQVIWAFGCMAKWQGVLATLRYDLQLHEGPVAYEDSVMITGQTRSVAPKCVVCSLALALVEHLCVRTG